MSLHAVNILGIKVTISSKKDILEDINKYLNSSENSAKKPYTIATPNPEQVMLARKDSAFAGILNESDVAIPDGIGLVWADPEHIRKTIPGVDFFEELVAFSAKQRVPIALIGGKENVALKTFECLRQKYPGLSGVALEAPEFMFGPSGLSIEGDLHVYFQNLVNHLKKEGIRMIFVGLGAPKQEYFIDRLSTKYPVLYMSVGGSFDEVSGRILRAPEWVSRLGIKWLWRLVLEPWRWKRQLALLAYAGMIVKKRFGMK